MMKLGNHSLTYYNSQSAEKRLKQLAEFFTVKIEFIIAVRQFLQSLKSIQVKEYQRIKINQSERV